MTDAISSASEATGGSPPRLYLENTQGGSSKFYRVMLIDANPDISVVAEWGKIGGANPQRAVKFTGDPDAAGAEMAKLADSKRRKGYVDAVDPGNAA